MAEEKPKKRTHHRTKYPNAFPNSPETIKRKENKLKREEAKKLKEKEYKASLVRIGHPLKFETPEVLAVALNDYFANTPFEEWTVTGLCLALGTTRSLLYRYEDREDYKDLVSKARLLVEHSYEIGLKQNGKAGDIFALKNMGWRDDRAFSLSGADGGAIKHEWKIEVVDPVTKEAILIESNEQELIEDASQE